MRAWHVLLLCAAVLIASGPQACTPQQVATLTAVDAVGRGLAHALGYCADAGADRVKLDQAVTEAKRSNYAPAVVLARQMVAELEAAGKQTPEEVATTLDLLEEVIAARAVEQGMRALSKP